MNTKNMKKNIISMAAGMSLLAGVLVLPVSVNAQSTATPVVAGAKAKANAAARLAKIVTRSDTAITSRITALNALVTKTQALKNVSDSAKTNISSQAQANISGLTSLKAKIDADTDAATALGDEKTITASYRIYALVIPQGYIVASADRVATVGGMLNTLGAKFQTRITADQAAGKDVSALNTALADMTAKVSAAEAQAAAAQNSVASLTPDHGDKTMLASNTAALKAARADIKTATADLKAAREDAGTIVKGIKALGTK
jgi:hypothetical protein